MHMAGEQRVAAPRQRVWEALNDPAVLRAAIPGCQSLEKEGDLRFLATVEVKIGPIGARFKGDVSLSDLDPARGYIITGQGSGGIAGSAKGHARVRLSDEPGGTLVSYEVEAEVGGRMAQLGGPIIDATAKNLAAKFFARFGEIVAPEAAQGTAPA
ncbi:MAG: carbon monoxide dehydrogenase subunit G, partial [Sphingomonadales bacterium]|nr:carbon monoxide dehydrogenase subunit G [Sphingomonadales bacterium]